MSMWFDQTVHNQLKAPSAMYHTNKEHFILIEFFISVALNAKYKTSCLLGFGTCTIHACSQ